MTPTKRSGKSASIANTFVTTAFEVARLHDIQTLIVQACDERDHQAIAAARDGEKVLWLTVDPDGPLPVAVKPVPKRKNVSVRVPPKNGARAVGARLDRVLRMPDVALRADGQLQLALLMSVLHRHIEVDDSVLFLGAREPGHRVDTFVAASPKVNMPWLRSKRKVAESLFSIASDVFARLLSICLKLSAEGREGRAIGTVFVLGNHEELDPFLQQLILNPCEGHPRRRRSIHDDGFVETLRELAALDGAFVVDEKGVVVAAGVYLDAPRRRARVQMGLGARHSAAAGITAQTSAVALVVSESSGTVTAYNAGKAILTVEGSGGSA